MKNNILSRMLPRLLAVVLVSALAIGCAGTGVNDAPNSESKYYHQLSSQPVTVTIYNGTSYSISEMHLYCSVGDIIAAVGYEGQYQYTIPSELTSVSIGGSYITQSSTYYTSVTLPNGATVYARWIGNSIVVHDTTEQN